MSKKRNQAHPRMSLVVIVVVIAVVLALVYQGGRWLETRNAQPEARGDHQQRYAYEDTIVYVVRGAGSF